MKLTKVEEQGMRLVLALARKNAQMTLPELAAQEDLSEALAAKVLGKLRQGQVVLASRGRKGGYELKRPPKSLTVADVVSSLGRPVVHGCFNSKPADGKIPCPHVDDCGLRPVWRYLEEQVSKVLQQVTIADLMKQEHEIRTQVTNLQLIDGSTDHSYLDDTTCATQPKIQA